VVYQDPAHQLGGHREKVGAVLPRGGALIDQAQICFVDEAGGLQSVIVPFPLKILPGELAQFFVDQGHQPRGRLPIAAAPIDEHSRNRFPRCK